MSLRLMIHDAQEHVSGPSVASPNADMQPVSKRKREKVRQANGCSHGDQLQLVDTELQGSQQEEGAQLHDAEGEAKRVHQPMLQLC